jgi:hypothetical protein
VLRLLLQGAATQPSCGPHRQQVTCTIVIIISSNSSSSSALGDIAAASQQACVSPQAGLNGNITTAHKHMQLGLKLTAFHTRLHSQGPKEQGTQQQADSHAVEAQPKQHKN